MAPDGYQQLPERAVPRELPVVPGEDAFDRVRAKRTALQEPAGAGQEGSSHSLPQRDAGEAAAPGPQAVPRPRGSAEQEPAGGRRESVPPMPPAEDMRRITRRSDDDRRGGSGARERDAEWRERDEPERRDRGLERE